MATSPIFILFYFVFVLQMCFNAFDVAADLDVLNHPILNFLFYLVLFLFFFIQLRIEKFNYLFTI